MYTVAEAAKMVGVAPPTMYYYLRRYGIGTKHGRDYVITDADIERIKIHREQKERKND